MRYSQLGPGCRYRIAKRFRVWMIQRVDSRLESGCLSGSPLPPHALRSSFTGWKRLLFSLRCAAGADACHFFRLVWDLRKRRRQSAARCGSKCCNTNLFGEELNRTEERRSLHFTLQQMVPSFPRLDWTNHSDSIIAHGHFSATESDSPCRDGTRG
jgi:hypothetical protein